MLFCFFKSNIPVAVKTLKVKSSITEEMWKKEVAILASLNYHHPSILKLLGLLQQNNNEIKTVSFYFCLFLCSTYKYL